MSRARQITAGALSLGLLLGLLGGVPYLLVAFVGWPLPHGVPTWSQFTTALGTRGIPDETLLKALAVAIWFAWASLAIAVLAETFAVARGSTSRHLPLAGLLQPLAGYLLAAVLVGVLALGRPIPSPRLTLPSSGTSMGAPIAAVLVADVTPSAPRTNGAERPSVSTTTTYVVRSDDTLWGIAATHLGDADRWQEIFELNRGHVQSDGRSLTNPHWIYPGWVLVLAATTHPTTSPSAPSKPEASRTNPVVRVPPTSVPTTPTPSPIGPSGPVTPGVSPGSAHGSAHVGPRGEQRQPVGQMPQRLPSGSLVGASFVAGVLALLALGRRRRRHTYRYRPPVPGRDLGQTPLGPTLRALRQRGTPEDPEDEGAAPAGRDLVTPPVPETDTHFLEIGIRDDRPIQLDRHQLNLLSFDGAGAEDVVRYVLNALLVEHGRGAVEILSEQNVLDALAPGAAGLSAARVVDNPESVVRALETELLARSRCLADADLPDIDAYRRSHPEDPVPTIAALLSTPDLALGARLAEIAESGPRLDLIIVVLDDTELGSNLLINANHRVVGATSERLQDHVEDAECFALSTDEASEICSALAAADPNEESEDVSSVFEPAEEAKQANEPWPEIAATKSHRAIEVRMLGAYRLFAHGKEVNRGRRRAAKELLAWYALRPEGATAEAAVDGIWPETEPDRVSKRFWLALGDLRTLCRDPSGETHVEVLVKHGERYAIDAEAVFIDVWEFQARLSDQSKASDSDQQRQALRSAVDTYRGDFAEDEDYLWIEPAREDLHRRALDAHLRLAQLEEELDAPERALEVLERAIALDHYAEEPYRRAMQLLARLERFDAIDTAWRSLQAALSDLNIEPDRETLALYRTLSSMRERERAASS